MPDREDIKNKILETSNEDLLDFLNELVEDGVLEFIGEEPIVYN